MFKLKESSILHANVFYLFTGILLVFVGSIAQGREIYSGLLITEYILILLPSILYIKVKGLSFKKTLRLNKISLKQIIYILGISIFTYPIAVFLNLIVISILTLFGELSQNSVPIPDNLIMYLISLFVISITPAICEEVMFRGVMMNAYEKISKRKAIVYSAILFGIFHVNIQNLVGPALLGIIFGITVYKTNSIYASIIGHGLNNAIAITIGYFINKAQNTLIKDNGMAMSIVEEPFVKLQIIISIIIIGTFALISFAVLKKLIRDLPMGENGELISLVDSNGNEASEEKPYNFNIFHYLPLLIFMILFLYLNIRFTYI